MKECNKSHEGCDENHTHESDGTIRCKCGWNVPRHMSREMAAPSNVIAVLQEFPWIMVLDVECPECGLTHPFALRNKADEVQQALKEYREGLS